MNFFALSHAPPPVFRTSAMRTPAIVPTMRVPPSGAPARRPGVTRTNRKNMFFRFVRVTPGLLAGAPLGGTLMVGTIAGVLMALVLNTGGGAWDNAKKFIEAGNLGGKGSPTHKAAVVGDTVGDPFKDTAGPSLHILVKLLSTITLVIAPLLI